VTEQRRNRPPLFRAAVTVEQISDGFSMVARIVWIALTESC
jgi:hypothetical protein